VQPINGSLGLLFCSPYLGGLSELLADNQGQLLVLGLGGDQVLAAVLIPESAAPVLNRAPTKDRGH
jgi:hypothetical protein